jgi:hypothetical protein
VAEPGPRLDRLLVPVKGVNPEDLRDNFLDARGKRCTARSTSWQRAARRWWPRVTDASPRSTATSSGGCGFYQYDAKEEYVYYYAHLERTPRDWPRAWS